MINRKFFHTFPQIYADLLGEAVGERVKESIPVYFTPTRAESTNNIKYFFDFLADNQE